MACDSCEVPVNLTKSLEVHIKEGHEGGRSDPTRTLPCDYCGVDLAVRNTVKQHMKCLYAGLVVPEGRNSKTTRALVCCYCGEGLTNGEGLQQHMKCLYAGLKWAGMVNLQPTGRESVPEGRISKIQ